MKNYMILLACMLSLGSCVDDDGNYDYKPARDLQVKDIEWSYKLTAGESLTLTPKIIERYDKEEKAIEGSKIEWFINDKLVGEGANYTFEAEENGSFKFNMKIEDPVTKSISTFGFTIYVESVYKQGFVVLSEKDNKAALSFIRTKWFHRPDTVQYTDDYLNVFEKHNKESLLKEPVLITENLKNEYTDQLGEISVLTRDGNKTSLQDLNGESLKRETYIQQEFVGEELPENWHPKQMLHTIWDSFVLNEDGKVYIRRAGSGEAYHTGMYSKDITLWNGKKFDQLIFADYYNTKTLFGLELTPDGKKQYVGILNDTWNASKNLTRLEVSGSYADEFKNIEDEILYTDWRRGDYEENGLSVAQKTPAGNAMLHCFNTGYVGRNSSYVPIDYSWKLDLTKEFGIQEINGLCTHKPRNYTYVASENTIYWVNNDREREQWGEMKTFDKKIVYIRDQSIFQAYSSYKVSLAIGFEDGTIEVWEINYNMPNVFDKKVYTAKNNFGKIKQILYKCGIPMNYLN